MTAPVLSVVAPSPLQVLQRRTTSPGRGVGDLVVSGVGASSPVPPPATAEVRTVALSECWGDATPWQPCDLTVDGGAWTTSAIEVSAGGWFRVEVRWVDDGAVVATGEVEPVGVGEVFVTAGQSYAAVCHEQVTTVADPLGRVVAACPEVDGWRIAHDPQPRITDRVDPSTTAELVELLAGLDLGFPHGPHSPFQGTIWPALGNALLATIGVPVGLVHCAVGGTKVEHWRRGTMLFANLCEAVALAGGPRAVLWQQGESDAYDDTPSEAYRNALRALRDDLAEASGHDVTWLPAVSTYHPTNDRPLSAGAAVRAAVESLWTAPGFAPGPDTDTLTEVGVHRAEFSRGGHFTGAGQRAAGELWADAVVAHLRRTC